ncbi:MAG: hypothetical protein ABID79_06075 [Elusimicrobiota bacterium]
MVTVKLICGIVLLFLGYIYLYRPKTVIKINFYANKFLFNDAFVLLRREKIGALFILFSIIAFYMVWASLVDH